MVQLLLEIVKVDPDSRDYEGRTPLFWAAENGNEATSRLLLGTGRVRVGTEDSEGHTPLFLATKNGHEAVTQLLIDVDSSSDEEEAMVKVKRKIIMTRKVLMKRKVPMKRKILMKRTFMTKREIPMKRKAMMKRNVMMKRKDINVRSDWEMLSGSGSGSDIPRRIRMPRHIHHSPSLIFDPIICCANLQSK